MRARDPDISHEEVLRLFQYDASTGMLYWRVAPTRSRVAPGSVAGSVRKGKGAYTDYFFVKLSGRRTKTHRLIWFYVYGKWPKQLIDHIDGNGLNNRIENLREVNNSQNGINRKLNAKNTHGYSGIIFDKRSKRPTSRPWQAYIKVKGLVKYLGSFHTKEEAVQARLDAEAQYFGEYVRKDGK